MQLEDHPRTAFAAASASTCSRTSCTRRIVAPRSYAATAAPTETAAERRDPIPSDELREAALARQADQHRPAERAQLVEAAHELEVVRGRLPEADPRVEADVPLVDPRVDREREPLLEEPLHVRDDVVIDRILLHRPRLAQHVHEAEIAPGVGDHTRELRVARAARSRRSRARRRARAHAARPPPSTCRSTPARRRGRRAPARPARSSSSALTPRRAGPGRLAADVDDRRARFEHPPRRRHRRLDVEVHAAVGERVGRDVDHAHHRRRGKALLDRCCLTRTNNGLMDAGGRYLWSVARRLRWTIVGAIAAGLAWQGAAIVSPLLVRHAVDAGIVHHQRRRSGGRAAGSRSSASSRRSPAAPATTSRSATARWPTPASGTGSSGARSSSTRATTTASAPAS